ncbi:MAG: inositol monophosphatase [Planctomycetes bacterium]|nr:inositol monophosphatase [Planctomycetota bacterium]
MNELDDVGAERWLQRLRVLQEATREALRARMAAQELEATSRVERDEAGDTIFAIDVDAEALLLRHAERWAAEEPFVLIAEGLEPTSGRALGCARDADARVRVIVDPIDGTRGLMFDKRSAWSLAAVAPNRGPVTGLADLELAVMTELPTTRQGLADRLWARRGSATCGDRVDLRDGSVRPLPVRPSRATGLRHGFATVSNFFQGGKELTARIDEEIVRRALGGWAAAKAEVYTDQYICSGGQLAELALGRDRFVLDVRPLVHRHLGHHGTLGTRPYDVCTLLCATAAGCVVTAPDGATLDAPLDTTTNVAFAGYANAALAETLGPIVREVLRENGLLPAQ